MQELRLVLIIVGALAIGALLFHGLWTSKREGKSKFGSKPLGKLDMSPASDQLEVEEDIAPIQKAEVSRKKRKEPDFSASDVISDPLFDDFSAQEKQQEPISSRTEELVLSTQDTAEEATIEHVIKPEAESIEEPIVSEPVELEVETQFSMSSVLEDNEQAKAAPESAPVEKNEATELQMEVLVLNVHCAGNESFVGSKLFDSMQQNGLLYGEMDIFHRHSDLSGTGKVLFSVANIMHPGTLKHDDPADFSTKGISFFMTLPCYGEADQNFKLMLKTAQQIADDLGGNVLDDQRNLMTPDRLAGYRKQIQEFTANIA